MPNGTNTMYRFKTMALLGAAFCLFMVTLAFPHSMEAYASPDDPMAVHVHQFHFHADENHSSPQFAEYHSDGHFCTPALPDANLTSPAWTPLQGGPIPAYNLFKLGYEPPPPRA